MASKVHAVGDMWDVIEIELDNRTFDGMPLRLQSPGDDGLKRVAYQIQIWLTT